MMSQGPFTTAQSHLHGPKPYRMCLLPPLRLRVSHSSAPCSLLSGAVKVERSCVCMSTCTRLCMTPIWPTPSSGLTAAAAPSTLSPRTRRSWLSAGVRARATARP
ncbi:hypothetical protein JZ751_008812 [Albula glossodonta]|uniref:Uncharacterized protein n=1 Tax=Albula glossodonta TaxID=121402 RepID=A0A8T2P801_9TELE|nr:hypothetical protein JZ751_008812 [Albula glossodonta]